MVLVAELLADLTVLKTINAPEALSLVNAVPTQASTQDADLKRAMEFLQLRGEQIKHNELTLKRAAVARVAARLRGEGEGVERRVDNKMEWGYESDDGRGGLSEGGGVRMAGGWGA